MRGSLFLDVAFEQVLRHVYAGMTFRSVVSASSFAAMAMRSLLWTPALRSSGVLPAPQWPEPLLRTYLATVMDKFS